MESMDDKPLLKKTLLTVAAMVGACVVIVGSFSLIALLVVGRATRPPATDDSTPVLAPTGNSDSPARNFPSSPPSPPKAPAKSNQI
jgi:hypothetical protein